MLPSNKVHHTIKMDAKNVERLDIPLNACTAFHVYRDAYLLLMQKLLAMQSIKIMHISIIPLVPLTLTLCFDCIRRHIIIIIYPFAIINYSICTTNHRTEQ